MGLLGGGGVGKGCFVVSLPASDFLVNLKQIGMSESLEVINEFANHVRDKWNMTFSRAH